MNLHEIGLKHKTDKATYHSFTKVYDPVLEKYIGKNIDFLEIGIWEGASINMWEEYFQNANITAVDILDKTSLSRDKVNIMIVNQEKPEDLLSIPGEFDVILEDGGHTMLQQQTTIKTLFNSKLKKGGIYILEDLHTSKEFYWKHLDGNKDNLTLSLIKDLQVGKISKGNKYHLSEEEFNSILNEIESVEIFEVGPDSITSVIKKK